MLESDKRAPYVLIVAKCNVNVWVYHTKLTFSTVLIVAKCNVNMGVLEGIVISISVLIVAKCNVNYFPAEFFSSDPLY